MTICNPNRRAQAARAAVFFAGVFAGLCALAGPAAAQAISLLQDTETERALKSYEDPILTAADSIPKP